MNQRIISIFYHDDNGKKVVITLDNPIDIPDECRLVKADGTYDTDLELNIENIEYMLDGLIDRAKQQWSDYIKSYREAANKHPDFTPDMVDWSVSNVWMKPIKHEFILVLEIMNKCNYSVDGEHGILDKYSGCIEEMLNIQLEIQGMERIDGEGH